jgi:aspartyl-tRNA(Asn)/glutamyl-tRNA(Gln) amidotransferase subunit B
VRLGAPAKSTANWLREVPADGAGLTPENLAEVVKRVDAGTITRDQAREVLAVSATTGQSTAAIVESRGFAQVSDTAHVQALVEAVIAADPKAVGDYRAGKKQALSALMAEVRKRDPAANPKVANELLRKLLDS